MFSVKKIAIDESEIPSTWIFKHYLKLDITLDGQTYKIKSVFNPLDKDPSLALFYHTPSGEYRFKCFSTGKYGRAYDIVMQLFNMSYTQALYKVKSDYHDQVILQGKSLDTEVKLMAKWEIGEYKVRPWNRLDVEYWSPYNIGSILLNQYNVKALANYVMYREGDRTFEKSGQMMYGYFTSQDQLYKIYQPMCSERKFMTLLPNYLQGWDQLEGNDRLFICSSLKDIMSMKSLGITGDYIAPQSENSQIASIIHWVNSYKEKYTIFDNDSTGLKVMHKYQEDHGIPYLHVQMSKDISDSVKEHGAKKVRAQLLSLLR